MSALFRVSKSLCAGGACFLLATALFGQTGVTNSGGEFPILGNIPGDQVLPSISFTAAGGCLAWQDNAMHKLGSSIGASLVDNSFNFGRAFRVNKAATGTQIKPAVQALANDRLIFVWQAKVGAVPYIYTRLSKNAAKGSSGYGSNFYSADIRVNTDTTDQQVDPAVAGLPDGSAIITWSSFVNTKKYWGVYARRLGGNGVAIAGKKGQAAKQFLVTQYASYNQRNPAVTVLGNGNYVITWISEQERAVNSIDVYARVFTANGDPVTDEIPVNSGTMPCAAPTVAPNGDGGFTVVWGQKDLITVTNGWDVWGRAFTASGSPEVADFKINTYLVGDQYAPKIAAGPSGSLVVWTSLGQDGSREGVYGRYLAGGTRASGNEFRVNTTTISKQIHPAVSWNGADRFIVVWTSYVGSTGFDLYGQAYSLTP